MEPLKSLIPFAKWLLRIAAALAVYSIYFNTLTDPDLKSVHFYIAVTITIFVLLLLIGGFMKKNSLTVTSGFIIFLLSLIMMFMNQINMNTVLVHFGPAAIGFYFMARGNKG